MTAGLIFLHRRHLSMGDMCEEKSWALIVPVPQGDVEASAKADSLNHASRKTHMNTKAPVPETDTGGWA